MADKYILDTHALIWYLEGNPRLGRNAETTMSDSSSDMVLPLIALAEAAFLIEKGRIEIPSFASLVADVRGDRRIELLPLTMPIFERSLTAEGLRIPELHDRLIVSTGLYLQDLGYSVSILTKDEIITGSGVLPVIW